MHTSVLLRHLFPSTFKPSDSSRVTSSPSLDLDQSCQAGEQAKFNSIGGVFLGSSSILHTSVLLGHSFPSTFKPSDSSRVTSSPSLDLDQSCQAGEQAWLNSISGLTSSWPRHSFYSFNVGVSLGS